MARFCPISWVSRPPPCAPLGTWTQFGIARTLASENMNQGIVYSVAKSLTMGTAYIGNEWMVISNTGFSTAYSLTPFSTTIGPPTKTKKYQGLTTDITRSSTTGHFMVTSHNQFMLLSPNFTDGKPVLKATCNLNQGCRFVDDHVFITKASEPMERWDLETETKLDTLGTLFPWYIEYDPYTGLLAGSGEDKNGARFTGIYSKDNGFVCELPDAGEIRALRFVDGLIYTGNTTPYPKVWDVRKPSTPLATLEVFHRTNPSRTATEDYWCSGLDVNDDIIAGGLWNWVYIWDKKTFAIKYAMKGNNTSRDICELRLSGTKLLCLYTDSARLYSYDITPRYGASDKIQTEAKTREEIKRPKPMTGTLKWEWKGRR